MRSQVTYFHLLLFSKRYWLLESDFSRIIGGLCSGRDNFQEVKMFTFVSDAPVSISYSIVNVLVKKRFVFSTLSSFEDLY